MATWWSRYTTALVEHPYVTNSITAGVIACCGDVCAQAIERHRGTSRHDTWSSTRSLSLGVWGATAGGVPMVIWFRYLDRRWPAKSLRDVTTKIAWNQLAAAPVMNCLFLGYTSLFLTQSGVREWLSRWRRKLQHDFLPTMARSLAFWSPLHFAGFTLVHPRFRVLFLSTGLCGWMTYLSLVGHRRSGVGPLQHAE